MEDRFVLHVQVGGVVRGHMGHGNGMDLGEDVGGGPLRRRWIRTRSRSRNHLLLLLLLMLRPGLLQLQLLGLGEIGDVGLRLRLRRVGTAGGGAG